MVVRWLVNAMNGMHTNACVTSTKHRMLDASHAPKIMLADTQHTDAKSISTCGQLSFLYGPTYTKNQTLTGRDQSVEQ